MKIAVILAAGIGSRLRPLTLDKPKCMVQVAGRPILDHQLTAYEEAGFERVYLIGGFRIDVIKAWLATRASRVVIEYIENNEFDTTNNMYSLSLLSQKLSGKPFYLSNGDVVLIARFSTRLWHPMGTEAASPSTKAPSTKNR